MSDYIRILKKSYEDNILQLNVVCANQIIIANSNFYVFDGVFEDLLFNINSFKNQKINQFYWENCPKGSKYTPTIAFSFSNEDMCGHILIECFLEIDDGGSTDNHNCCFYVRTELGMLDDFFVSLSQLMTSEKDFYAQIGETQGMFQNH